MKAKPGALAFAGILFDHRTAMLVKSPSGKGCARHGDDRGRLTRASLTDGATRVDGRRGPANRGSEVRVALREADDAREEGLRAG